MAHYSLPDIGTRITPHPQRVTPFYIVDDIHAARRRYSALGFDVTETEGSECLGMTAGDTGIMLVTPTHAARTMPLQAIKSLDKGPALYVCVDSIDAVRCSLADPIIGERVTDYGTWELFVESRVGLVIFAEKMTEPEEGSN